MDEHFDLYEFRRSLSKADRNRPDVEERFYQENDGEEFRAFASAVKWPFVVLASFLQPVGGKEKDPETLPVSGSVRQQCC